MILADGAVSDRSVYTSLTPVHAPSSNGGVVGKLEAAETLDRGSTSFALPLFTYSRTCPKRAYYCDMRDVVCYLSFGFSFLFITSGSRKIDFRFLRKRSQFCEVTQGMYIDKGEKWMFFECATRVRLWRLWIQRTWWNRRLLPAQNKEIVYFRCEIVLWVGGETEAGIEIQR